MKKETLRIERVTYKEQGRVCLDNFNMTICNGEILGLVPVNSYGLDALLKLLEQNEHLHYGYVYFKEKLVNQWQKYSGGTINKVSVIQSKSCLIETLTVSDNIFVLREGLKKWLISPKLLRKQLQPFLAGIGIQIDADSYVCELSVFECFIVELLKAIIAGSRLIVLKEIGTIVSDSELAQIHQIIKHYAQKGFSFLYIASYFEEARQLCDRTGLMIDGQIIKYFSRNDSIPDIYSMKDMKDYEKQIREQSNIKDSENTKQSVFEIRNLTYKRMKNMNISALSGECLILHDLDNSFFYDFIKLFEGAAAKEGEFLISGQAYSWKRCREIAVIQESPTETMLFSQMSYIDNLCFSMDHRLKKIWFTDKIKKNIKKRYCSVLGEDVFYKNVDELTQEEKYDLVYTRILLQKPKVVICVHPFRNTEVSIRSHICVLIERLLENNITVVILAINLTDSLLLADRLIRIKNGKEQEVLDKNELKKLSANIPWLNLYYQDVKKY